MALPNGPCPCSDINCPQNREFYKQRNWYYTVPQGFYRGMTTSYTPLIINEPKSMKLSAMLKLMLGADEQVLYKAGYINGDLELTEKGKAGLVAILFAANKATLVKLAQADLDEEASKK